MFRKSLNKSALTCCLLLTVSIACCLSTDRIGAEVVLEERFDNGSELRLLGSASLIAGETSHIELTGGTASSTGAVWFRPIITVDRTRTVITWEHSMRLVDPKSTSAGGIQLVLRFREQGDFVDTIELDDDSPSESLGSASLGRPFIGVALDLAQSGKHDADGIHVEVNETSDPALAASVETTDVVPDITATIAAEDRTRISVVLEDRIDANSGERTAHLEVYLTSEHDNFGTRRVIETQLSEYASRSALLGIIATSGDATVEHRVHGVRVTREPLKPFFIRGDCNQDGTVCSGVSDMISIVSRCFLGGPPSPCEAACDADANGQVCGSVTDVVYIANYCFGGSNSPPPAPYPECGPDTTSSNPGRTLPCESPSRCGHGSAARFIYLGRNDRGAEEFLRLRDEMVMVLHPAGEFEQGDHYGDRGEAELPVHRTRITQPFLLGKFEVTNAQYRRFLEAIGCTSPDCKTYDRTWDFDGISAVDYDGNHYPEGPDSRGWSSNANYFESADQADHPVLWIDWFDAVAYARWASDIRRSDAWAIPEVHGIPSEAQWEYAARFRHDEGTPHRYPWGGSEGDQNDPQNIHPEVCNFGDNLGRTLPVSSLPAGRSSLGVYHQSGNVYEWTADWYDPTSYFRSPLNDPFVFSGITYRQLRGGGWFGVPFSQRGAYRCNLRPGTPDIDVGMRVSDVAPRSLIP